VPENVLAFDDHGTNAAGMPEVDIGAEMSISIALKHVKFVLHLPANSGALDCDCDLAWLEARARQDIFGGGLCFGNPEIMLGVGVDSDVGLGLCDSAAICVAIGKPVRDAVDRHYDREPPAVKKIGSDFKFSESRSDGWRGEQKNEQRQKAKDQPSLTSTDATNTRLYYIGRSSLELP
jgi:hypothetical protein